MNKRTKPLRDCRPRGDRRATKDDLSDFDPFADDSQFRRFLKRFRDTESFPVKAHVIGESVVAISASFDGNIRRGLTVKVRRADGGEYVVALCDVEFPRSTPAAKANAEYRDWLMSTVTKDTVLRVAAESEAARNAVPLVAGELAEVVVLSAKGQTGRCRFLSNGLTVTIRADHQWVPSELLLVKVRKLWTPGDPHLSAAIEAGRLDPSSLALIPLRLEEMPPWDPQHEYWGDEGETIPRWAKTIIARGSRPAFQMELVLPGWDFNDPEEDPIGIAVDLTHAGKFSEARSTLMRLCEQDLRCLDAHAHLGNLEFEENPFQASLHYQAGLRIGELSLPPGFSGVLSWHVIENRPFLRCLHGYGLCLWRFGNFKGALTVFDQMLWLNPSDNQGVRFLIPDLKKKAPWDSRCER